jgi:hypothetical protein
LYINVNWILFVFHPLSIMFTLHRMKYISVTSFGSFQH